MVPRSNREDLSKRSAGCPIVADAEIWILLRRETQRRFGVNLGNGYKSMDG